MPPYERPQTEKKSTVGKIVGGVLIALVILAAVIFQAGPVANQRSFRQIVEFTEWMDTNEDASVEQVRRRFNDISMVLVSDPKLKGYHLSLKRMLDQAAKAEKGDMAAMIEMQRISADLPALEGELNARYAR